MRPHPLALATLWCALGLPATAEAAAPPGPSTPGALQVQKPGGEVVDMPLRHTSVSIEVSAFVARTTVEQVFANPYDEPVEAVYTFPLSHRAAVDDFELQVGDRTIRGVIKRREEARAVYEEARAAGYQAALLEQERPNVFTQSVANLEPGKEIVVRLKTVETLVYERGTYRLTFPLVVGPRYVPEGVRDADRVNPPILAPGLRSGHDVSIDVAIDAGVPLASLVSPSHRIVATSLSPTRSRVQLADGDAIPNKDFLLRWSVAANRPAVGFLAHREDGDGFFTLLVQPKGEVSAVDAAPKEITFVIDTSGSMSGVPIEASKRLIARALHELGPRDTFNLVRFAGDNEVYSQSPLPNDRREIERAIEWVNRQQGGGGTELLAAMRAAFARPPDPNRIRLVVFLTDGYVGNEDEILADIKNVLGDARIYTVGIGSSVNHHLLDGMASLGRGAYVFVRPDEPADDALDAFRSWVTRPYLTDLDVDWGSLAIADPQPERLPDLGSGQTLTIVGRYVAGGEGDVVVHGKLGGIVWQQRVHVVLPDREPANDALASVWARQRIDGLTRASYDGTADSIEAEITALALEYRLMSPYTSFVAVDDSRIVNPNGNPRTIHQAVPIPDGVSFEGIFGKEGPAGLRAKDGEALPEDSYVSDLPITEAAPAGLTSLGYVAAAVAPPPAPASAPKKKDGGRDRDFKTTVSGVSNVDPLAGRFQNLAAADSMETITVVTAGASAEYGREHGGVANAAKEKPVAGRVHQEQLTLAPGFADEPPPPPAASARLGDAAIRVLADLSYDGKLSPAEGVPALAALLAAQRPSGAIASNVATHALATWALAEAAATKPVDPLVVRARDKALDYLVKLADPARIAGLPTGSYDAEGASWARRVAGALRPTTPVVYPTPGGSKDELYARLRLALDGSREAARPKGHGALDRLIASLRSSKLRIVKV